MTGLVLFHLVALPVVVAVFAAAILAARRVAIAVDLVARPNPIVRSHRAPVPYLGGTGLIVAWLALLVTTWAVRGHPDRDVLARSAGALAFVTLGTWDDARPLGPWFKLLIQSALCAAYLAALGLPLGPRFAVDLLVLVTLVNAYNIIDVMDGLLCLLGGLVTLGLLVLWTHATHHMMPELGLMLIGLAVLFAFNRPPARIYAGDAGSLALGFLAGAWGLSAAGDPLAPGALPFVGLWGVPLIELALVIPARLAQGRSPLRGSPDHYALRLQDSAGWSKWRVLGVTALVGGLFAAAPSVASRNGAAVVVPYAIACVGAAALAWLALWRIPPHRPTRLDAGAPPSHHG